MNKKHAFVMAFLITGLIASNIYLFSSSPFQNTETAIVSRVIDGDTIEWDDGRQVRLQNINAPEKNEHGYELAINYLKPLENQTVELEILGTDRYYRTLARVYSPDYLNLQLVNLGFVKKAWVQKSELKEFSKAEEDAVKNFRGIWGKSSYYGCFKSDIDKKAEFVKLTNTCDKINLKDWTLRDESRKSYKFLSTSSNVLRIHSEIGENNETDIFWNSKTNVWNNDRDTLYLFDKDDNIAHYHSYGY